MKKLLTVLLAVLMLAIPFTAYAESDPEEGAASEESAQEETASADLDAEPSEEETENGEIAADAEPTPVPTPEPTAAPAQTEQYYNNNAPEIDPEEIRAVSAVLMDADTGQILYAKNEDWTIFPASTTKLLTAILTVENCDFDEMVTFTSEMRAEVGMLGEKGSLIGMYSNMQPGDQISVRDLFYGLLMNSGNDAALALAIHIAGSEEAFVRMMNQKAAEIGMENTHFINPSGIYIANVGQDHVTTAADMALLGKEAMTYPEIVEACQTEFYVYTTAPQLNREILGGIQSSNYLLHTPQEHPAYAKYLYPYATGLKTGTINNILPPGAEAPIKTYGCLVASASQNDLNLIVAVFGDTTLSADTDTTPNAFARWEIAKYLFDYGFENYSKVNLTYYAEPIALTEPVQNASQNDPENGLLDIAADLSDLGADERLVTKETADGLNGGSVTLDQEVILKQPIRAPVELGQEVGEVIYSFEGQEVCTAPLLAVREVFAVGEEEQTSQTYNVPVQKYPIYLLYVIIAGTAGAVALFAVLRVRAHKKAAAQARRTRNGYQVRYSDNRRDSSAPPKRRKHNL